MSMYSMLREAIQPINESSAVNDTHVALRVSCKPTTNPNDPVSHKAVHLDFYNKDEHIGQVFISSVDTDNGFIYNLVVFKKYRGQGYGRQIMEYVLSHYKAYELTVEADNTTAVTLYKSMGFKLKKTFTDSETRKKMLWMRRPGGVELSESTTSLAGKDVNMSLYNMLSAHVLSESAGVLKSAKLFHLSEKNLDGTTLTPRVPSNSLTRDGYEESETSRISLSTSVQGSLVGISNNLKGKEFYIHVPSEPVEYYQPSIAEVPDVKCSHEVWVKEPIKLKLHKKIVVTSAQDDPLHYKLGDKIVDTYKWNYDYISS